MRKILFLLCFIPIVCFSQTDDDSLGVSKYEKFYDKAQASHLNYEQFKIEFLNHIGTHKEAGIYYQKSINQSIGSYIFLLLGTILIVNGIDDLYDKEKTCGKFVFGLTFDALGIGYGISAIVNNHRAHKKIFYLY